MMKNPESKVRKLKVDVVSRRSEFSDHCDEKIYSNQRETLSTSLLSLLLHKLLFLLGYPQRTARV